MSVPATYRPSREHAVNGAVIVSREVIASGERFVDVYDNGSWIGRCEFTRGEWELDDAAYLAGAPMAALSAMVARLRAELAALGASKAARLAAGTAAFRPVAMTPGAAFRPRGYAPKT